MDQRFQAAWMRCCKTAEIDRLAETSQHAISSRHALIHPLCQALCDIQSHKPGHSTYTPLAKRRPCRYRQLLRVLRERAASPATALAASTGCLGFEAGKDDRKMALQEPKLYTLNGVIQERIFFVPAYQRRGGRMMTRGFSIPRPIIWTFAQ